MRYMARHSVTAHHHVEFLTRFSELGLEAGDFLGKSCKVDGLPTSIIVGAFAGNGVEGSLPR